MATWSILSSLKHQDKYFLEQLGNVLDKYTQICDKYLLIDYFNAKDSELSLSKFLYKYKPEIIVQKKICFKSLQNPNEIDLFVTNNSLNFENKTAIFIGLSNHHRLVVTVIKETF